MKISWLLSPIQKYAPEVITPFFADYISKCETAGDTTYNYGYGSLKWVMFHIAEVDPERATLMLFMIMAETIARNIDQETIEHKCYRLFCLRKYRPSLRDVEQIDVTKLKSVLIGNRKAILNDTGRRITGMILRNIPDARIIISVSEDNPSLISFARISSLGFEEDLIIDELGQTEGGWEKL
jgi:hypothetical protein